ncbi:hypothetical protein [Pluralibacter gergoviae]|uniref:hypothetical protein n=1 Tax=Pluralibacter gergoviae TaxID=61647 RepID=UPI0011860D3B|nr:hypothetical protein [Pluralibacter gergoviae]
MDNEGFIKDLERETGLEPCPQLFDLKRVFVFPATGMDKIMDLFFRGGKCCDNFFSTAGC